jgi:hypothetical protein
MTIWQVRGAEARRSCPGAVPIPQSPSAVCRQRRAIARSSRTDSGAVGLGGWHPPNRDRPNREWRAKTDLGHDLQAGRRAGDPACRAVRRDRLTLAGQESITRSFAGINMRLRGVEPPRALAHTDLNRARLPVPPQPREQAIYRLQPPGRGRPRSTPPHALAKMAKSSPLSSRGLGRRILSPETGVRIPVAVFHEPRKYPSRSRHVGARQHVCDRSWRPVLAARGRYMQTHSCTRSFPVSASQMFPEESTAIPCGLTSWPSFGPGMPNCAW